MKIIDTHCHPQMSQFDQDRTGVIQKALGEGIGMICVGTDLETSSSAIKLAEQYEDIWASVGLHPNDNLNEEYDQSQYFQLAQHPKVVAIGEVGLDYYRTTDPNNKKFQRERFEEQIELAIELNKPLIIHCRDAHQDMIEILGTKNLKGAIHSFTGTLDDAKKYIELGFYIGFNGIVTFTDQYNDIVCEIPVDKVLLETDAPFLAPIPYRGKRNEPSYIIEVAKKIAELRGTNLDDLLVTFRANSDKLFKLL